MPTSMNRDHIVSITAFYWLLLLFQVALSAAIVILMLPYTGPDHDYWPTLHRYVTAACVTTLVICCYYLLGTYAFPPAYNCWTWLICCIWQVVVWVSVWVVITYDAGTISWQLRTAKNENWMTDSEFAEFLWMQRVAMRYYAASIIGGIQTSMAIVCLVLYAKALSFHRYCGAPYVFNGRWGSTSDTSSTNTRNFDSGGHETESQIENPFADGQGEGPGHLTEPSQSYEMHSIPQSSAPPSPNAKDN